MEDEAVHRVIAVAAILIMAGCAVGVQADVITDADIYATTGNDIEAGNGLLDFLFFDGSTTGEENFCDPFDGDDANTDMPHGGATTVDECYITSVGELRGFYELCFTEPYFHNIFLCIDLNEDGSTYINLNDLTVVVDYDQAYGDLRDTPAVGDIDSDTQNLTDANFSGGTTVAWLDDSPKLLPLNEQGAGWADYFISLGIDPFDPSFTDDTRILFHWASTDHTDGAESIFISGTYIPEPGSLSLLALAGLMLMRRRRP
jgi:hypothetical protein